MLVVLLIAGMALALTTQALGQYQRAHLRASASAQAGREYRLGESWFRNSVRSLAAVPETSLPATSTLGAAHDDEASIVFEGKSDSFTGVTLSAVLAGQGVPVVQRWNVVKGAAGNDLLELEEQGQRLLLPFPGNGQLRLHYVDDQGDVHLQWPPALGVWPQLPSMVVLELVPGSDGVGAAVVAAAVIGPKDPLVLPYEPEPL